MEGERGVAETGALDLQMNGAVGIISDPTYMEVGEGHCTFSVKDNEAYGHSEDVGIHATKQDVNRV